MLKKRNSQALVLKLMKFQQYPFDVETYVSGYAMRVVLMQGGRPISYHFEVFHGAVLSYSTYEKELYALVQVVNKWKHDMMGKETIIHTYHQPLQYL